MVFSAQTERDALLVSRREFQSSLLAWFEKHQRPLPWRATPSVYKTVVSELMLQQTQVKTVLPYFARWLEAFPDFAALAAATEDRVLKHWEGLGYYSRARNLHRLAKAVAALPEIPRTPDAWAKLPGVGPYTSAAVTSISFGHPVACVDGNVVRILARLTADGTAFRDSASAAKSFGPLANELIQGTSAPGDFNQAMMELGATVCHRQNPLCTVCPVYAFCAGTRTGEPENFPRLAPKSIEAVEVHRIWWIQEGSLLLHRAANTAKRFANMHELPKAEDVGIDSDALTTETKPIAIKKRTITRFAITEKIYDVSKSALQGDQAQKNPELVWVPVSDLPEITLSGPHRKWVEEILRRP